MLAWRTLGQVQWPLVQAIHAHTYKLLIVLVPYFSLVPFSFSPSNKLPILNDKNCLDAKSVSLFIHSKIPDRSLCITQFITTTPNLPRPIDSEYISRCPLCQLSPQSLSLRLSMYMHEERQRWHNMSINHAHCEYFLWSAWTWHLHTGTDPINSI